MPDLITCEPIVSLNSKLKRKITLQISDLKDEYGEAEGTRVVFGEPCESIKKFIFANH